MPDIPHFLLVSEEQIVPGAPPETGAVPIACRAGQTVAQALYLSGRVEAPALCSGLALCGRCKVRFSAAPPRPSAVDERFFSEAELALGWRLGCRHAALPGMRLEPPEGAARIAAALPAAETERLLPLSGDTPEGSRLALDFGTTAWQWRLEDAAGKNLWHGTRLNPQMGAGSEVLSRLAYAVAPSGGEELFQLTLAALQRLVQGAAEHAGPSGPGSLCLSGNTAMTALSLGLDCRGLGGVPYSLPYTGGEWVRLPGLPPIWLPPPLSPFVGGDIAAGYAALALSPATPPPEYPFLLADMGTNGEFLLALSPDEALVSAVPLGPALEGIGLACGTEARPRAVTQFSLEPGGLVAFALPDNGGGQPVRLPQGTRAAGITGTGYLSLAGILAQTGIMDREGRFTFERGGPLGRLFPVRKGIGRVEAAADGLCPAVAADGGACLLLPGGLALTAGDVEEILKVKAAFSLGLRRLLESAGCEARDVRRVFLAGALGRHVRSGVLEELGFFPPGMGGRLELAGNTSLEGAALFLRAAPVREVLLRWSAGVKALDLASDAAFVRDYAEHMRFVY